MLAWLTKIISFFSSSSPIIIDAPYCSVTRKELSTQDIDVALEQLRQELEQRELPDYENEDSGRVAS